MPPLAYDDAEGGEMSLGDLLGPAPGGAKPKPKGKGGKAPMAGEGDGDEELPPGFEAAAEEFLDAEAPMGDRVRALKRAIHLCYPED